MAEELRQYTKASFIKGVLGISDCEKVEGLIKDGENSEVWEVALQGKRLTICKLTKDNYTIDYVKNHGDYYGCYAEFNNKKELKAFLDREILKK